MNSNYGHDDVFELTPPALLWLHEFERANGHISQSRMWRDLHARAKGRGTSLVRGMEWPGSVYIPSSVMDQLIQRRVVKIPERWSSTMPVTLQGRMLSLLTAWEIERGIYSFTKTSADLVSQCTISAPLKSLMFDGLPAPAIYIDLLNIEHGDRPMSMTDDKPWGLFVGVDQPKPGTLDLVLAIDRYSHLDVQVIPIKGQTLDELAIDLLRRSRSRTTDAQAWAEAEVRDTEQTWQLAVSAVLMTCINQHRMIPLDEDGEGQIFETRKSWTRWEVGHGIDEQINAEKIRRGNNSILVGQWCQPKEKEAIRLQFSAGCQLNWHDLERRHGGKISKSS